MFLFVKLTKLNIVTEHIDKSPHTRRKYLLDVEKQDSLVNLSCHMYEFYSSTQNEFKIYQVILYLAFGRN